MISKYLRIFNTLKYLKPTQLAFFILRRKLPGRHIPVVKSSACRSGIKLGKLISMHNIWKNNTFRFLNVEKSFPGEIDWSPEDVPRLWRYNLHYFDYLRQADRTVEEKISLINHWIENNLQGSQPAWEPFTTSLRIVNWIFFLVENPDAQTDQVLNNLYTQVLWLEKNDERHILANHYFENLKALVYAGVFFQGDDADRWRKKATRELSDQLEEQTLTDGGHYERSPQYHGLMVENYLDLYNLCVNNQRLFDAGFIQQCQEKAQKGIQFLNQILFPDQTIPLFNDSAFGISPTVDQLDNYFKDLFDESALDPESESTMINYPDSGFFGCRLNQDMVLFDAGDIGPSYQPGHTHCDMLSYELMWHGERLVVDTGVCEYEPGEMRHYVRSTRAHNTVSIDQFDQSEVWGEFRVARRAKVLRGEIDRSDNSVKFIGSYRGFPQLKECIIHTRTAEIKIDQDKGFQKIVIADHIDAQNKHVLESFVNLHPSITISQKDDQHCLIKTPGGHLFRIQWDENINCVQEEGFYCPEFSLKIPTIRLVFNIVTSCPATINYSIEHITT